MYNHVYRFRWFWHVLNASIVRTALLCDMHIFHYMTLYAIICHCRFGLMFTPIVTLHLGSFQDHPCLTAKHVFFAFFPAKSLQVRHHLEHVIKQARSLKNKSPEWRTRRKIPEDWDASSVRVQVLPSTCERCNSDVGASGWCGENDEWTWHCSKLLCGNGWYILYYP